MTLETVQTPAPTPFPTPFPTRESDVVVDPSVGCSGAMPLVIPASFTESTVGERRYSARSCGFARAHTSAGLWYSVEGTGEQMIASTCDLIDFDTQLSVWTGDCESLTCVGGSDDACGLRSSVSWFATTGETYYIFVCESQ